MKTTNASTALALILGLGLGVASLPAGANDEMGSMSAEECDADESGFVSAEEASLCAGQQFGELTGDEDRLTEEQFGEMYEGDDAEVMFGEMDEDADAEISEEEWVGWHDREFSEASEGTEGEMAGTDFDEWVGSELPGTRVPAERSP